MILRNFRIPVYPFGILNFAYLFFSNDKDFEDDKTKFDISKCAKLV